jgi:phenylpyruvate tautomerase PptA (4-oxalocrotonate tautomerase family)
MPIIDIELVYASSKGAAAAAVASTSPQALADALGHVFASAPGRTWVRLHFLDSGAYAENDVMVGSSELPVFVTILHAHPPSGAGLITELKAVTDTVARLVARPSERVHVQYAPAAAGRQAFGGRLVE